MIYQEPVIEIVMFNDDDIITSSGNDNVGAGNSEWIDWKGGVWDE